MATAKKNNTPKKTNSSTNKQNKGNTNRKKKSNKRQDAVRDDIILIVALVVSLLLILSYINLCGPVGRGINYVVFGLVGVIGYAFPFILFFGIAFYLANKGNRVADRKILSLIVGVFALASLVQLIAGYDPETLMLHYFDQCGTAKSGGGVIGSLFLKIFYKSVGSVATVIILIAILLICFMLITGKTLVTYIKGAGSEKLHQRMEAMRERRLEDEEYDDEAYDEVPASHSTKRRSAKIVNLQQTIETAPIEEEIVEEEPQNFVDSLKDIGKKGKKKNKAGKQGSKVTPLHNPQEDMIIDMQEIIPEQGQELSITGSYIDTENNSIYENELKRKFGDSNETQQPKASIEYDAQNFTVDVTEFIDESVKEDAKEEEVIHPDTGEYIENKENMPLEEVLIAEPEPIAKEEIVTEPTAPKKPVADTKKTSQTEGDGELIIPDMNLFVEPEKEYVFPDIQFLSKPPVGAKKMTDKELKSTAHKLQSTLESFGVRVAVTNVSCGPAVTRYELQPEQGVKVSKITSLSDDIKLNLAASDIRIEAPIAGKAAVGIEVPNKEVSSVYFRELIEHEDFKKHPSDIAFAVGKDIGGQVVVTDIAKMPHLLIAGATGSGKSVCINTLIMSILYKSKPSDVKLIMIDPKVVELSIYNGIPHLLIPVVTDPKQASAALNWAVMEMTDRYAKFAEMGVRDLKGYNAKVAEMEGTEEEEESKHKKLPQMVIIVDELADLMMVASKEVETAICRLAQMARAAGMHLIIATQRPSVNVITGVIKANVPSRIAFSVSSAIDSRTIIDGSGAESLLGKGDMLFFPSGIPKPIRVQGAFVSDKEVGDVVAFLKEQNEEITYNDEVAEQITNAAQSTDTQISAAGGSQSDRDDYFVEAGRFIIEKDKASIGMLQRVYKIGFNRAARIMDQLADAGVVGPEEGTKPRKIVMTMEEFEQMVSS